MRLTLAALLGMAWVLGLLLFHVTAPLFHALAVLAVVAIVGHLARAEAIDVCDAGGVTTDQAWRH